MPMIFCMRAGSSWRARQRARNVGERAAAGMEVEAVVEARQQGVLDPVGDLLGDGALGIAGIEAVEIAVVDRRGALAGHGGGEIGRRQDDQPALDILGLERAQKVAEADLAFPFVAMRARLQEHAGSVAVLEAHDGDRNPAIGRAMHRMRHAHEAVRLALGQKVDVGRQPAHGREVGLLGRGAQIGSLHSRSLISASATSAEIAARSFSPFSALAAEASPMTPIGERLESCRQR